MIFFSDCPSDLRSIRKRATNKWPDNKYVDDHLSTAHIAMLQVDANAVGYGALITDQHVITSFSESQKFKK